MTSSESIRAFVFVALALIGCLLRTYIRTANDDKETALSQSPRKSTFVEPEEKGATSRSATSSGQVSQLVSVRHEQPPTFPDPGYATESAEEPFEAHEAFGDAYEDWAAMRLARGGCPDDTDASFDSMFFPKPLANFDGFGISGASTPSIWTTHFPASQLRPY